MFGHQKELLFFFLNERERKRQIKKREEKKNLKKIIHKRKKKIKMYKKGEHLITEIFKFLLRQKNKFTK